MIRNFQISRVQPHSVSPIASLMRTLAKANAHQRNDAGRAELQRGATIDVRNGSFSDMLRYRAMSVLEPTAGRI
jgi:hypothetical protein